MVSSRSELICACSSKPEWDCRCESGNELMGGPATVEISGVGDCVGSNCSSGATCQRRNTNQSPNHLTVRPKTSYGVAECRSTEINAKQNRMRPGFGQQPTSGVPTGSTLLGICPTWATFCVNVSLFEIAHK